MKEQIGIGSEKTNPISTSVTDIGKSFMVNRLPQGAALETACK
jgi:hypothetical protein